MPAAASLTETERHGLWLFAHVLLTAGVTWTAFALQQEGIAPAILFPALVGAVLGGGEAAMFRFSLVPSRRVALAGAVVWGLLAVLGQDYIGHRHRIRIYDEALLGQASSVTLAWAPEPGIRPTFAAYLAGQLRTRPIWWSLDVALASGVCVFVTALSTRTPGTPSPAS